MAQRYDLVGEYDLIMAKMEDGDYVLYEDYARLSAEVERLKTCCTIDAMIVNPNVDSLIQPLSGSGRVMK